MRIQFFGLRDKLLIYRLRTRRIATILCLIRRVAAYDDAFPIGDVVVVPHADALRIRESYMHALFART